MSSELNRAHSFLTKRNSLIVLDPMKKVCKNRKNCGKIEITQEDEILWEEENEN